MVEFQQSYDDMVHAYSLALEYEIDRYWDSQDFLKRQSAFYNDFYSWDRRAKEWVELIDRLT